ncbi:MAG: NADH-quinone oxidoreductase subunit N [Pseudomonadota bacterium]
MNALTAPQSLGYFVPELVLVATAVAVFLVDLFIADRDRREGPAALLSLAGLATALGFAAAQWTWPTQALFSGMVVVDPFSVFFKVLVLAATIAVIVFLYRSNETVRDAAGETYGLLLVLTLSAILVASSSNLLMIYLAFEGVSLVSYILAGLSKHNKKASEAALKYVVYGGVASGVMLFGMSYLFGLTGSLDLVIIRERLQTLTTAMAGGHVLDLTLVLGVVFMLAGIGYKVAAAPFHMWCPDVYEGSPTPITAYFSVVPKAAGVAIVIRFFYVGLSQAASGGHFDAVTTVPWVALLGVIAAATMTMGNFGALWQTNLKRLLAYSSISHAGYMLMGIVVLGANGLSAVLFYMAVYTVMNLGAFFCVIAVRNATGEEDLAGVRGLGYREPILAASLTVFMLSLTGLPPLAGFIGKYFLFASVLEHTGVWYDILVVVAVINSAVSLFYYAKVLREMYLSQPVERTPLRIPLVHLLTIVVFAVFILVMGFVSFGISSLKSTTDRSLIFAGQPAPDAPVAQILDLDAR